MNNMEDPNGTNFPNQSAGGGTKIKPTSQEGDSYAGHSGYGFMTNAADLKIQGEAPKTSEMPVAQPIPIMTSGDPNKTGG